MQRDKVEQHLAEHEFQQALAALETMPINAWRDTTQMRCLRSLGLNQQALALAEELYELHKTDSLPYPTTPSSHNNQLRYIALIFSEQGKTAPACRILSKLCELTPEAAALHREYAFSLVSNADLVTAETAIKTALELEPDNARNLDLLAHIYQQTGRVSAAYHCHTMAATLNQRRLHHLERVVSLSNGLSDISSQQNKQLAKLWAEHIAPPKWSMSHFSSRLSEPSRKLRVGFVSGNLIAHSLSFYLEPLLSALDKKEFEIYLYSDVRQADAVTEEIKSLCHTWTDSTMMSDATLADTVYDHRIDIMFDLDGHNKGNRLGMFALRPAPLQIGWLGCPGTRGLPTITHRITDRVIDPRGGDNADSCETPLRLPCGLFSFQPLSTTPAINPTDNKGIIRFGAFTSLDKLSTHSMDNWATVLHSVPDSTLYLKRQSLTHETTRNFIVAEFAQRGIAEERLILKPPTPSIETHLAEYNHVDIALDTSPHNGVTTTLEALWMGVPVITQHMATRASRYGASILHQLGLDHYAPGNSQEFVDAAVALANDATLRQELRKTLRTRMQESSLLNHQRHGREFGNLLRKAWIQHCSTARKHPAKMDHELSLAEASQ